MAARSRSPRRRSSRPSESCSPGTRVEAQQALVVRDCPETVGLERDPDSTPATRQGKGGGDTTARGSIRNTPRWSPSCQVLVVPRTHTLVPSAARSNPAKGLRTARGAAASPPPHPNRGRRAGAGSRIRWGPPGTSRSPPRGSRHPAPWRIALDWDAGDHPARLRIHAQQPLFFLVAQPYRAVSTHHCTERVGQRKPGDDVRWVHGFPVRARTGEDDGDQCEREHGGGPLPRQAQTSAASSGRGAGPCRGAELALDFISRCAASLNSKRSLSSKLNPPSARSSHPAAQGCKAAADPFAHHGLGDLQLLRDLDVLPAPRRPAL